MGERDAALDQAIEVRRVDMGIAEGADGVEALLIAAVQRMLGRLLIAPSYRGYPRDCVLERHRLHRLTLHRYLVPTSQ